MKRVELPDDVEVEDANVNLDEDFDPNDQSDLGVYKRLVAQVFLLFENDESSPAAFKLGLFIKFIIIFAILAYMCSTVPLFTAPPDPCPDELAVCNNNPDLCPGTKICPPEPFPVFGYIETMCVAFFSFDYILRVSTSWSVNAKNAGVLPPGWEERNLTAKVKEIMPKYSPAVQIRKYILRIPNLIDFCAIMPYYLHLIMPTGGGAFMRVLRLFRLVRVLRLLKALSFLKNVDVTLALIGITIERSSQTLIVFMFFVMIMCILFGCIIFMVEQGTFAVNTDYPMGAFLTPTPDKTSFVESAFISVPAGMFWSFGPDVFPPVTDAGRCITCILFFIQILALAFPVGIIAMEFEVISLSEYLSASFHCIFLLTINRFSIHDLEFEFKTAYRVETRKLLEKSNERKRQTMLDLRKEQNKLKRSGSRKSMTAKSENGDGEDDGMSVITDLPPPLPPPLGVYASKVQDSVKYNIELIKGYVAELEQLKEDLLDYDELRQKNQLPPLDKDGKIIEDPANANGDNGPKLSVIERIAKALEPQGTTNRNGILTPHTLSELHPMHTLSPPAHPPPPLNAPPPTQPSHL